MVRAFYTFLTLNNSGYLVCSASSSQPAGLRIAWHSYYTEDPKNPFVYVEFIYKLKLINHKDTSTYKGLAL